jgi:Putative zinc-finger
MGTHCNDIETLLPTYLDGELGPHDQLSIEHHLADCEACRNHVRTEGAFQARVRELLAPPAPPAELEARVREALDRDEKLARAARRQIGRSWALPGMAAAAAAASLMLFVAVNVKPTASGADRPAPQARVTPVETSAPRGTDKSLLSLSVFGAPSAPEVWRPRRLWFEVQRQDGGASVVTIQPVSCSALDLRSSEKRLVVGGAELWVGRKGRLGTVTFDRGSGVCFVFTADMDPDQLVSGLVRWGVLGP